MTKTYHVSLTVEVLACVRVDDGCPDDVLEMIACESVSLSPTPLSPTGQRNVSLEMENIDVDDIVEITQEANDAG